MINRNHIKAARTLLDWSQLDLAKAAGLSISTIATIEQGRNMPERTAKKILSAFAEAGVRVSDRGVEWERGSG